MEMIGKGAQAAGVVADVNDASGPLPTRLSLADAQALAWRLAHFKNHDST